MMQNKVEEAEGKYRQIEERLEGITQQVQELQPESAQLKSEAREKNAVLNSREVRVQTKDCTDNWYIHFHTSTGSDLKWLNSAEIYIHSSNGRSPANKVVVNKKVGERFIVKVLWQSPTF